MVLTSSKFAYIIITTKSLTTCDGVTSYIYMYAQLVCGSNKSIEVRFDIVKVAFYVVLIKFHLTATSDIAGKDLQRLSLLTHVLRMYMYSTL